MHTEKGNTASEANNGWRHSRTCCHFTGWPRSQISFSLLALLTHIKQMILQKQTNYPEMIKCWILNKRNRFPAAWLRIKRCRQNNNEHRFKVKRQRKKNNSRIQTTCSQKKLLFRNKYTVNNDFTFKRNQTFFFKKKMASNWPAEGQVRKREKLLAIYKGTNAYKEMTAIQERTNEPMVATPNTNVTKRVWEKEFFRWKNSLKETEKNARDSKNN